ncbi:auxin-responsive protein IAA31 isoform X2 [Arachis duranensis]|uniref:Auxin-induced protein n=1 Tax=Arachis duranensis TaxID=130453 RepID=A0A6P4C9N2_ARADU|nr:auxin-responsive protein IAA31 isoform X2 [Arachis duranensis]
MEEMVMATLDLITASPHSSSSSSSSPTTDNNNNHPSSSSSSSSSSLCLSSISTRRTDLSTDLRLGLSLSPSHYSTPSREQRSSFDWPPVKSTLRCTLVEKSQISQFVKVYMEGIPIGRKLNLLAHHNYHALVKALANMFRTTILCPDSHQLPLISGNNVHVLTYEDQEGDWMMVGDVPWEMFLTSVKKLKITRADRC